MKFNPLALPLCVALGVALPIATSAADAPARPGGLKFKPQLLHVDNNEGCAIADFNKDGKLDVSAGETWYAGPDFKQRRAIRRLDLQPPDYLKNNAEHAWDVNGDGWPDLISGSFMESEVAWFENPKAEGLDSGAPWKRHLLIDTKLMQNEWTDFRDLDGDQVPEFIVNSWNDGNPMACYKLTKDESGKPDAKPWVIHPAGKYTNGHGIGFGDINGDGLEDMIYGNG